MSVLSLSTSSPTGIGLKGGLWNVSASAKYHVYSAGTNISQNAIIGGHHKPGSTVTPSFADVVDVSRSYRVLRVLKGTNISSIAITSPTGAAWANFVQVDSTTQSVLYIKAISYDSYSSITVRGYANYGYSFYRWRNGGAGNTIVGTSATFSLSVTTLTTISADSLWVEAY